MRGRKPTPTALRVLRGNPRKHPLNAREPMPGPLALEAPAWLDPSAAAEWRRLAPLLGRLGVLTETDADALAAYCEAFTTWRQATQKVRQGGMVVVRPDGVAVVSPWVKVAQEAMTQLRALLIEFGMTPSARSRIHAAPVEAASKWGSKL